MRIRKFKEFSRRRRYVMAKLKEKVSIEEILIDEIENSSTNDWDELCNACSSLIKDAKMTDKEIDNIVKKVKNGTI